MSKKSSKKNKNIILILALLIVLVVLFAPKIKDLTGKDVLAPAGMCVPLERCIQTKAHDTNSKDNHHHSSTAIFSSADCVGEGFVKLLGPTGETGAYVLTSQIGDAIPLERCIQTKAHDTNSKDGHHHSSTAIFSSADCVGEGSTKLEETTGAYVFPSMASCEAYYSGALTYISSFKIFIDYTFENTPIQGRVIDQSVFRNDGVIHGSSIIQTTGKVDEAYQFPGDGFNYIETDITNGKDNKKETVSYWFKADEIIANMRIYSTLSSLDGDGSDPDSGIHARGYAQFNAEGKLVVHRKSYSTPDCQYSATPANDNSEHITMISDTVLQPDTWYHVVEVWDREEGVGKLYINGVLDASQVTLKKECNNDNNFLWLARRKGTNAFDFEGLIDEFKIYNDILFSTQIADLHTSESGGPPPRCGDGTEDPGEDCDDGDAANSDTETDACREDCTLAGCGDDVIDTDEVCDNEEFGSVTCATLKGAGYTGTLECSDDCLSIDDNDCAIGPGPVCGDGAKEDPEECDDHNIITESCLYGEESCIVCDATCNLVAGDTSYCDDGIIDSLNNEVCDCGGNACTLLELDNNDCTNELFATGTLGCSTNCLTFDKTNCAGSFEACSDSLDTDEYYPDGKNEFFGGTISKGLNPATSAPFAGSQTDACVANIDPTLPSTKVREWYCDENYVRYLDITCPTTCNDAGTKAYCTHFTGTQTPTCSDLVDTDPLDIIPGKNEYIKGTTIGIHPTYGYEITRVDYCDEETGELIEFYCDSGEIKFSPITCLLGYECSEAEGICKVPGCGDGDIRDTEQCDDGDIDSGDGCSSTCTVESGYQCTGEPSICNLAGVPPGTCTSSNVGERKLVGTTVSYCSQSTWLATKAVGDPCSYDYQCIDNMCSTSGTCLSYDAVQDAVCTYVDSDTLSGSKLSLYNSLCGA